MVSNNIGIGAAMPSGLLEDFPPRPRPRDRLSNNNSSAAPTNTSTRGIMHPPSPSTSSMRPASSGIMKLDKDTKRRSPKSVRFTQYSAMVIIERPKRNEARRSWYNRRDYDNFKYTLLRDQYIMKCKLAASPAAAVESEDVLMCVGMEKIFTPLTVQQRKAKHLWTILNRQDVVDAETLSRLSRSSSKWTRHRSHKLAAAYWNESSTVDEELL